MNSEKLCLFCRHLDWEPFTSRDMGESMGSETVGGISCKKSHYAEQNPFDTAELRALMLTAEQCADYAPPK